MDATDGTDGVKGPRGRKGITGDKGVKGPKGPPGSTGIPGRQVCFCLFLRTYVCLLFLFVHQLLERATGVVLHLPLYKKEMKRVMLKATE